MELFTADGILDQSKFAPEALQICIEATKLAVAPKTRGLRCKIGHMLLALWPTLKKNDEWRDAVEMGLLEGLRLADVPEIIEVYVSDTRDEQVFELVRKDFDDDFVRALESCDLIEDEDGNVLWHGERQAISVAMMCATLLNNPGPEEKNGFKGIFDFSQATAAFAEILSATDMADEAIALPDFYSAEGELQLEYFGDSAVAALETAKERAGALGYEQIRPPHLFLALLERVDGIAEEVIRLQARIGMGPKTVIEVLLQNLSLGSGVKAKQLSLNIIHLAQTTQAVLEDAFVLAVRNDSATIDERFLLQAVLEADKEGMVGRCLTSDDVNLNIEFLLRDINKRIRDFKLGKSREDISPFLIPANIAKSEDLTYLARTGQLRASVGQDKLVDEMLRGLHKRQNNNILITGESGVGKTELVRELSRKIGEGDIAFLKRKKVVRIDCDGIPPDQSRDRFNEILSTVKGRNDVIVCLDKFENIVNYSGGSESHNRDLIRVALNNHEIHLICIIEDRYFTELLAYDYGLIERFKRVEVLEVETDEAVDIIKSSAGPKFSRLYGVEIAEDAISRAVTASKEFIMSERLPIKAIKILRDACERVSYIKDMEKGGRNQVRTDDVVEAVAERTGIDSGTIAGLGSELDFYDVLSKSVVGQDNAVETVANRLKRIKAGATREGKPAAVFLFAGLTGTGKTELAKAIAQIYSASGKMSVYPMTNFGDSHSKSGLFGVPPGYVGYESGGRLINDLNADAYGIILFDEAEKAHPDIWQSMLGLFDEAWCEDHRNVKAYANRAIIILTSNAGQDIVRNNYKSMNMDELKDKVSRELINYTNSQGNKVFSPEFLGRFTDIVIFNPLSEEAMLAITRLQMDKLLKDWQVKRGKKVIIEEAVVQHVAKLSYEENESHGGTKGGRIVAKLISDLVELKMIDLMVDQAHEYKNSGELRVLLEPHGEIAAKIEGQIILPPLKSLEIAEEALKTVRRPDLVRVIDKMSVSVETFIEQWSQHVSAALPPADIEKVQEQAQSLRRVLESKAEDFGQSLENRLAEIIETLQAVSPDPDS